MAVRFGTTGTDPNKPVNISIGRKKSMGSIRFEEQMKSDELLLNRLLEATASGDQEEVSDLIENQRADVNNFDGDGKGPLMVAVVHRHAALVDYLVEWPKTKVNIKDKDGKTCLHWAVLKGFADIVRLLIEQKIRFHKGHVCRWIKRDIDVDAQDNLGMTPLMYAAEVDDVAVAEILITRGGADVNATDDRGKTAIMHASAKSNYRMAQVLMRHGANHLIEQCSNDGSNSVTIAVRSGDARMARMLLDRGLYRVDARDGKGRTPMMLAASSGHAALADDMVKKGARSAKMFAKDGTTAEHRTLRRIRVLQK